MTSLKTISENLAACRRYRGAVRDLSQPTTASSATSGSGATTSKPSFGSRR